MSEAKEAIEFRSTEEKAHIDEITTAVREGNYRIDSNLVAARILDELGS
jgi:anti-sigma28 factor (negative regulator of flagellin synthesis)